MCSCTNTPHHTAGARDREDAFRKSMAYSVRGPLGGLKVQPTVCVSLSAAVALMWGSAELMWILRLESACSCTDSPHHTARARDREAMFRSSMTYLVCGPLGGFKFVWQGVVSGCVRCGEAKKNFLKKKEAGGCFLLTPPKILPNTGTL